MLLTLEMEDLWKYPMGNNWVPSIIAVSVSQKAYMPSSIDRKLGKSITLVH